MPRLSLGSTIAQLTKAHRNWQKYVPDLSALSNLKPSLPAKAEKRSTKGGRLQEMTGFGSNPGALRMLAHIPKTAQAHPALVVVLHGCTQTATGYDHNSGWSKLADDHGFAVLFPEQVAGNNANTCFNWFQPEDTKRDQGEAQSIRQMIEHLITQRKVDRRRIFITGLSAGGAMANAMLATYPEVFAAGAVIAGLPYGCAGNVMEALTAMKAAPHRTHAEWGDAVRQAAGGRDPSTASWPAISVWHGAGDRVVSLSNGRAIASQWTDVHGLKETVFAEKILAPNVTQRRWGSNASQPSVELITITGLGHGTPIDPEGKSGEKSGIEGPFMLDAGISSTLVMARQWGLVPAKKLQASAS